MITTKNELVKEQITKSYHEILFVKFIFSFINCLSMVFVGLILRDMLASTNTKENDYIKLLEVSAALFVPYITFVAQGYCYPRSRKINVLRYLLFRRHLDEEDTKIIYDK